MNETTSKDLKNLAHRVRDRRDLRRQKNDRSYWTKYGLGMTLWIGVLIIAVMIAKSYF